MEVAKVFMNGGSQAVRLPKTCRFDNDEVLVNRIGDVVMLMPKVDQANRWHNLLASLDMFTDDFLLNNLSLSATDNERQRATTTMEEAKKKAKKKAKK